jgi:hypothetical protein
MKTPIFTPANLGAQRDALIAINVEYLSWVAAEAETYFGITPQAAIGMTIAEYVPSVLDTICGDPPPHGIFYLVELDPDLAGMGGLRWSRPGVAEIKRLYVRPTHRGPSMARPSCSACSLMRVPLATSASSWTRAPLCTRRTSCMKRPDLWTVHPMKAQKCRSSCTPLGVSWRDPSSVGWLQPELCCVCLRGGHKKRPNGRACC